MRILSRYVVKEFGRFFAFTLAAFVLLFVIGDFIEKLDDYIEHKAAVSDVLAYLGYQMPNIVFMVMPLAILLSTLLSLGMLSKNGEVVAMKASGVPLYRIAAPIMAVAALLSGAIFWANETIIPYCNSQSEYIRKVRIEKKPMIPSLKHDRLWFRGPEGEIINIGLVEFKNEVPTCYGVTFYRLNKSFQLAKRVDAEEMRWNGGKWVLKNGSTYDFGGSAIKVGKFLEQEIDLPEKPEDFKRVERLSEEMTFSELDDYIDRLKREGYNPVKYMVDLHGKVSFTLANIIMVIVAVPFSLKSSRSGGMALGIGLSVIIAISYWFIYSFSMSLGHAGRFPPLFAAWLANMLFFSTGVYMLLQTDK